MSWRTRANASWLDTRRLVTGPNSCGMAYGSTRSAGATSCSLRRAAEAARIEAEERAERLRRGRDEIARQEAEEREREERERAQRLEEESRVAEEARRKAEEEQRRQEGERRRSAEEKRLQEREGVLDRKFEVIETRDKDLSRRASDLGRKEKTVEERQAELDKLVSEERRRLEQLAGLSATEAKAELVRRMEEEAHADAANRLREIRDTAKRTADREAKKIVALAVQRIAAEHTAEITVSAVSLPKDEMKGRIIEIGRAHV